jgi:hypothetical protein
MVETTDEAGDPGLRLRRLAEICETQAGIVTRTQAVTLGFSDDWIEHRLDTHRWQRIHAGVYASFSGPLTLAARHWASVLVCGRGAVLAGRTAVGLWLGRPPDTEGQLVEVAIEETRHIGERDGIDVWRVSDLWRHVHPVKKPPRMRLEAAVLLLASRTRDVDEAIGVIADACQSRRTTPDRLRKTLDELPTNVRHRRLLGELLDDVATGAYSYLEVRYLRDVERPHGLPTGCRQRRVILGRSACYRDVEYLGYDVVAELDGRLGHEEYADRAADLDRDIVATEAGKSTIRLGYRQVLVVPCGTARHVADLLHARGWRGRARDCGPTCGVRRATDG